jgi:glycosyltransferase involved in cell wall biosynthesis
MTTKEGAIMGAEEGTTPDGGADHERAQRARPALTIGVPVYNGEKYLGAALRSLAAQTWGDYEIVLCDNASTDGTPDICREHAARDPRIRYVRNPTNLGVLGNFDRAAALASGEFFMWAASDDLWEPRFVERMVAALRANPEASLAYCDYDWVDDDARPVTRGKVRFIVDRPSPLDRLLTFNGRNPRVYNFLLYFVWRNPFLVYGMYRTEALRRVLPFTYLFSDARHADNVFMLRFLARERVVVVDELLFHYRQKHRTSVESMAMYQSPGQSEPKISDRESEVERALMARVKSIIAEAPLGPVEARVLAGVVPVVGAVRFAALTLRARWSERRR